MMSEYQGSLDGLKINTYKAQSDRKQSFTGHEVFALGWTYKNTEGRSDRKMQDCRLTLEQCQRAVEGLIEIKMLISP
ncbi:MAG: hypothetical protein F6J93_12670 [Oscillatoria sp. SIO1A7]|nr:hypothetical protein [Oscillatoria sp. SIO1A7]